MKNPLFTLLLILFISLTAVAENKEYIHGMVVYRPYFVPEAEIEEDNSGMGFAKKTMKVVYKNAGLNVKWVEMPYARVVAGLKTGDVQLANLASSPEIDSLVTYPVPSVDLGINTYSVKGQIYFPKTIEDFQGKRVGIIRNWPLLSLEELRQKPEKISVFTLNKPEQGVKLLLIGRIDYLVMLADPIREFDPVVTSKIAFSKAQSLTGFYTGISKASPESSFLQEAIKNSFQELLGNQTIIMKKGRYVLSDQ